MKDLISRLHVITSDRTDPLNFVESKIRDDINKLRKALHMLGAISKPSGKVDINEQN